MKKRKLFKLKKPDPIVEQWKKDDSKIRSDVLGSYTGVPIGWEKGERPVQDVDDL